MIKIFPTSNSRTDKQITTIVSNNAIVEKYQLNTNINAKELSDRKSQQKDIESYENLKRLDTPKSETREAIVQRKSSIQKST